MRDGHEHREQEVEAQEHPEQPGAPPTLHSLTLVKEINNFSWVYIPPLRDIMGGGGHSRAGSRGSRTPTAVQSSAYPSLAHPSKDSDIFSACQSYPPPTLQKKSCPSNLKYRNPEPDRWLCGLQLQRTYFTKNMGKKEGFLRYSHIIHSIVI